MVQAVATTNRHVVKKDNLPQIDTAVTLDKAKFQKEVNLTAVKVPVQQIQEFSKQFSDYIYKRPKVRTYVPIEDDRSHKYVLMQDRIVRSPVFQEYNAEKNFTVHKEHKQLLSYDNFSYQEVLQDLLPAGVEIPGGFEIIGSIVHLNLSENQMPYRRVIGQVIMDKNATIKTVVSKIGQIETTFRFYDLECIAGDDSTYETIHVEDKVRFKVDISRVYWCSKLSTERSRVISDLLKPTDILCDMFCGVGPLAVKAAVKLPKLRVLANDLNPIAHEYLEKNIKLNKLGSRVIPFNMDARTYLRMLVDKNHDSVDKQRVPANFLKFQHCMMNLPMDAVEFLDCFIGAFSNADESIWRNQDSGKFDLPMIHVYGFTNEPTEEKALAYFVERIGKAMQFPSFKSEDVTCFHNIRDVSPQSHMYSTSFRLPEAVAFAQNADEQQNTETKIPKNARKSGELAHNFENTAQAAAAEEPKQDEVDNSAPQKRARLE